jgi:hypothetical protein
MIFIIALSCLSSIDKHKKEWYYFLSEVEMKKSLFLIFILFSVNANATLFQKAPSEVIFHSIGTFVRCNKATDKQYLQVKKQIPVWTKRYKEGVVDKFIDKVYLCGDSMEGQSKLQMHGFYDEEYKTIWLRYNKNIARIELTFHHELSSYILRNMKKQERALFYQKWIKLNKSPYIPYTWNKHKDWRSFWEKGFIAAYSMSTFENDFNVVAQLYASEVGRRMMNKKRKMIQDNKLILQKLRMVAELYKKYLTKEVNHDKTIGWINNEKI